MIIRAPVDPDRPAASIEAYPSARFFYVALAMSDSTVFLTAEWRFLAMLNYVVDSNLLLPYVPAGTELDIHDGHAFVTLVGFLFLDTRIRGVPIPFHQDFEEVNLRFYVRRTVDDETRHGVVFIKEIVPKPAIAAVARMIYNERYVSMPMMSKIDRNGMDLRDGGSVEYGWRRGGTWNRLKATTEGPLVTVEPGSHEEFITEHYWGYSAQRDGGTVEYRVEHPRWRIRRAASASIDFDVKELYGEEFTPPMSNPPFSAFVAEGSPVVVHRGVKI